MSRPLSAILADIEAALETAHGLLFCAMADLALVRSSMAATTTAGMLASAAPTDCAGQAPGAATPGSGGLPRTTPDPAHPAGVDIDAVHKRAQLPSKVIGGAGSRTVFYELNGETVTVRQLAILAGCSYKAMQFRLLRRSPAEAVAMGAGDRAANARKVNLAPPAPPPAPVAPPLAPRPSVFEYRAPAVPVPTQTSTRVRREDDFQREVKPGSKLDAIRSGEDRLDPKAEAIVPPDVKRTVYQQAPKPPVPSTFGRIGEYESTGSAIERALKR